MAKNKIKFNEYNLGPSIKITKIMLHNFDIVKCISDFNKKFNAEFILLEEDTFYIVGEKFTNLEIGDILHSLFIDKNFNESIQTFIISKNVQAFWTEFLNQFIEYCQLNDFKMDIPTNFKIEVRYLQNI